MRYLTILSGLLIIAACNTAPVKSGNSRNITPSSEVKHSSVDSILQFLLTASATDFYKHRPPDPLRFRDVRLGHLTGSDGVMRYILCGQFLPREGKDEKWMPFVTIRTDPYEQWLGNQASSFCNDSKVIWENMSDLSSLLQSRLDALR